MPTSIALQNFLIDIMKYKPDFDCDHLITMNMSKAFDTVYGSSIISGFATIEPPIDIQIINVFEHFLAHRQHFTKLKS